MDKSQTRVRAGFMLGLAVVGFAFVGWLVTGGVPTEKEKTRANVLETLVEERSMAELLKKEALKFGGPTNIPNEFILNPFHADNERPRISFEDRTNASGKAVDIWQMPFQIKLVGQTNFIIWSAGPDQKFGDSDDIIFNSVSNDFVNP
jgi:hypothetical protein